MVPKEIAFNRRPARDFFLATTRLPPQDVQRMPTTVLLMMILSKSSNPIAVAKMDLL
ncbi:MAG: hypothetical protein ABI416_17210 [Ginsengibacter sp.]